MKKKGKSTFFRRWMTACAAVILTLSAWQYSSADIVKAETSTWGYSENYGYGLSGYGTLDLSDARIKATVEAVQELVGGSAGELQNNARIGWKYEYPMQVNYQNIHTYSAAWMQQNGSDCTRTSAWIANKVYEKFHDGRSLGEDYGSDLGTLIGSASAAKAWSNLAAESVNWQAQYKWDYYDNFDEFIANAVPGSLMFYGSDYEGHTCVYLGKAQDAQGNVHYLTVDCTIVRSPNIGRIYIGVARANITGSALTSVTFRGGVTQKKGIDVKLNFHKTTSDSCQLIAQDNPQYSLAGAVYEVRDQNGKALAQVTTDESGYAKWEGQVENENVTLSIVEVSAPAGMKIDPEIHTVTFTDGRDKELYLGEDCTYDSLGVTVIKDSDQAVKNPKPLADTIFEVRYYGQSQTLSEAEIHAAAPTRTWQFRTVAEQQEDGSVSYELHTIDPDCFVSGDELYHDDTGAVVYPLGTYTLKEITPAEGYLLTDARITAEGNVTVMSDQQTILYHVTENSRAAVTEANIAKDTNTSVRSGSFKVQKHDPETNNQPQGDAPDLTTEFEIVNENDYGVEALNADGTSAGTAENKGDVVTTITTDKTGLFSSPDKFLPYGSYTIRETKAPEGYTMNGVTEKSFTISEDKQVIDLTNGLADNVKRGGFTFQKNDKDYSTRSQGDTDLTATFELYNRSKNAVVVGGTTYAFGAKITTFSTDSEGKYATAADYLPYGTYEIRETVPPVGYTSDGTVDTTFSITDDQQTVDLTQKIYNRVDYGKFSVHKVKSGTSSDWGEPEADVEFTAILSSKIGEGKVFATWDDAYYAIQTAYGADVVAQDGTVLLTVHEYSVVKTDSEGNATSGDLAYGTYTIKQTSHAEETTDVTDEATFVVSKDNQPIQAYTATNKPTEYYLALTKLDLRTGEKVSLNSASFKIKNTDTDEYVTMKVGFKKYDTFRTSTQDMVDGKGHRVGKGVFVIPDPEEKDLGTVVTPLTVTAGHYQIEEVETPDGFVTCDPVTIEVKEATITSTDEDGIPTAYVDVKNDRVLGELTIEKSVKDFESDYSFIDQSDLSSVEFTLTAAEDIINPDNGEVAVAKGDLAKDVNDNVVGDFFVNKDGNAEVKDILLGRYTLKEKSVPSGMVLSDETYDVVFEQAGGDYTTKTILVDYRIENDTHKTAFTKKSVTGDGELAGATLAILDENGKAVKKADGSDLTWVSSDKPYIIEGLATGSYQLSETIAPKGYVKRATNVPFTVEENGDIQTVEMVDKTFDLNKVDAGGKEVSGASMKVLDKETGETVDQWISDGTVHNIENLVEGKSYTIHEEVAPNGYVVATDIDITVTSDYSDNQHETMTDKIFTVKKMDECGKALAGAEFTVYALNEDGTQGAAVDIFTTDETGSYNVNGLKAGETYLIVETGAPEGYTKAADRKVTVEDDGKDQTEKITDKKLVISKEDAGGEEVPGAVLTLTDKETGEVIDHWTSTDEKHEVTGAEVGKTYVLTEDTAPLGYIKAAEIEFTVTGNGIDQRVTMIDYVDTVNKVDENGEQVNGAVLTVTNAESAVVDTWTVGQHIVDLTDEQKTELQSGKPVTFTTEAGLQVKIIPVAKKSDGDDSGNTVTRKTDEELKEEACKYASGSGSSENTDTPEEPKEGTEYTYTAVVTGEGLTAAYYDIDLDGNETGHRVSGLTEGESYTVHEVSTVKGYYFADDEDFTLDGEADSTQTLVDNSVKYEIVKIDDEGKPVAGVVLKLTDVTDSANPFVVSGLEGQTKNKDGNDSWVTTDQPIELNGVLEAGHKYELEETEIVSGVWKATTVNFETAKISDGKPVTITMVDELTHVSVLKTDNYGKPLAGAEMQILEVQHDENGEVIRDENGKANPAVDEADNPVISYEFTSTDDAKGTDVSQYVKGGETYILRESEAPFGFAKIVDTEFTVTGKEDTAQVIVAKDERRSYKVKVRKMDGQTKELLAGAEIGLFYEDGTPVTDIWGNPAKGLTDANGEITFTVLYADQKMYAQEVTAPEGYQRNQTKFEVKVTNVTQFDCDPAVTIGINDAKVPDTGIRGNYSFWMLGGAAGTALFLLYRKKKQIRES